MMRLLLAGALLALAPALAVAQVEQFGPPPGGQEFTLSGTGSNDDNFDRGSFGATASYSYYFTENVAAGVRQTLLWANTGGGSDWSGATRVAVDYHFGTGRLRPFVGANLGVIYGDGVDEVGVLGPEAGLKYYANRTTFLYGQAEYQIPFGKGDSVFDTYDDGSFVYTVGIGFNF